MDVTNRTDTVDLTNYVPNGEWELLEARLIRNVVYYSCCPEPFPDLTVTLKIRRKILFYMVNVVLPCMMMSGKTILNIKLLINGFYNEPLSLTSPHVTRLLFTAGIGREDRPWYHRPLGLLRFHARHC